MNDELTPQEQEALANLTRERMPAGLEERVVGAMREHGFIAPKRARIVRITNSRVAGLLAACAVLMIGAYSIGLHRGDERALQGVTPPRVNGSTMRFREVAPLGKSKADEETRPMSVAEQPMEDDRSLDWKLEPNLVDPAESEVVPEAKLSARGGRADEVRTQISGVADAVTKDEQSQEKPRQNAPAAPSAGALRYSESTQSSLASERRFQLNGSALIVDAPDSVRVVQDEQGRVLLIYTSDGIIKIRLADTP